jgi:hypothetical protein
MIQRFILLCVILCISAYSRAAGLVDLKFGKYQIADSQWNVSTCMYTTTCQIYRKNPGTAYKIPWTSGQLSWATGDYVAFVTTGNGANPWNAIQYSANGTQKAVMGTGRIINMGNDYFFFVGNDNNTGQLFSMTTGFSNTNGVNWTGTLNPTVAQVNAYAANGSTTPLGPGQTAAPAAPAFAGTLTQTNAPSSQVITSGTNSTAGISTSQQAKTNAWSSASIVNNNIYMEQIGDNNTITIVQTGNKNLIKGIGQQNAKIDGDSNQLTVYQGVGGAGQNQISLNVVGDLNKLELAQANTNTGIATGSNGHYLYLDIAGSNNNVAVQQTNNGGVGGHYLETIVTGNSNNIINKQLDNGNKTIFATVSGNNNSINATQQGTGQHQLDLKLSGNNHSASVNQSGSTQNKASIDLTNAGGAATLNLIQTGSQLFSIVQSCGMVGGCATTVTQP